MSVEVKWDDVRGLTIPDKWERVWTLCPYTLTTEASFDWLVSINAWISDPERPGQFAIDHSMPKSGVTEAYQFAFSDPNTAFEFKMRWG